VSTSQSFAFRFFAFIQPQYGIPAFILHPTRFGLAGIETFNETFNDFFNNRVETVHVAGYGG
jgi:hypothetical protein